MKPCLGKVGLGLGLLALLSLSLSVSVVGNAGSPVCPAQQGALLTLRGGAGKKRARGSSSSSGSGGSGEGGGGDSGGRVYGKVSHRRHKVGAGLELEVEVEDGEAGERIHFELFDQKGGMKERLNGVRAFASKYVREAKGAMSSELEQTILKATRPDEGVVKSKHLTSLLRPSFELPQELNVHMPAVKKLWAKMRGSDWRTVVKALYVLHMFAADGSTSQASNLKDTMSSLSAQIDPKSKVQYFDLDSICAIAPPTWSEEIVAPYTPFIHTYAKYVLARAAEFGPGFTELMNGYAMLLTSEGTEGRSRPCLVAVRELITLGLQCTLSDGADEAGDEAELREKSVMLVSAQVAVAQDLHDVLEAAAAQLDFLSKESLAIEEYPEELERWHTFLASRARRVEEFTRATNRLAKKHSIGAVPPLTATVHILKKRQAKREIESQALVEEREKARKQEKAKAREARERAARGGGSSTVKKA
ncbi:unnamed protein product [Chrysoparadoxa australica]